MAAASAAEDIENMSTRLHYLLPSNSVRTRRFVDNAKRLRVDFMARSLLYYSYRESAGEKRSSST